MKPRAIAPEAHVSDAFGQGFAFYLAVLPAYRRECIELLRRHYGDHLKIYASAAHLDATVRTNMPTDYYIEVRLHRFGKAAFVQTGRWRAASRSATLVVDLNPRSITAWVMLLSRARDSGKRTLVWGHLHPRAGSAARSSPVRRLMRRLSDGMISYTHSDKRSAMIELPDKPVWVATNALYSRAAITPATTIAARNSILYVGRLEPAKRVETLVRAMPHILKEVPEATLVIVGDGSERHRLEALSVSLGVAESVSFEGWIDSRHHLRHFYGKAFATASPGFAGLGLTQSLGFGIPMLIAEGEPHSPEIELARDGAVRWFASGDVLSFTNAAVSMWRKRGALPIERLSKTVRDRYSAESMADGIRSALEGQSDATTGQLASAGECPSTRSRHNAS